MERMDGDIHLVVVLIGDADNLLVACFCCDAHKSDKSSDAEIDMHDVVACFHFQQFFHCERHLACSRCIAAEVIFMESVEDLVVGEEAYFGVVVYESLMQGFIYRCKVDVAMRDTACCFGFFEGSFIEDVSQSLILFGAVGKDIEVIFSEQIVFHCLHQEVEVLVEEGLWRGVEVK